MKRTFCILALLSTTLFACEGPFTPDEPDPAATIDGAWAYAGGLSEPESPRNGHYSFDVEETGTEVTLSAEVEDIDARLYVLNELGEVVNYSTVNQSPSLRLELDEGEYEVVVCGERGRPSDYTLSGEGIDGRFGRLDAAELDMEDEAYTLSGGDEVASPRNIYVTFDVTEDNAWVDIVGQSEDGDLRIHLYDPLGQRVDYSVLGRDVSLLRRVSSGRHTVVVAAPREVIGSASIYVAGEVRNLSREAFQTLSRSGSASAASPLSYAVTVTASSSLDVAATSPSGDVRLELYDPANNRVEYRTGRSPWFVEGVNPGTYRVVVVPTSSSSTLSVQSTVVGKVTG